MKKVIFSLFVSTAVSTAAMGQTGSVRMIVHQNNGAAAGFLVERVNEVTIPQASGQSSANASITVKRNSGYTQDFKISDIKEIDFSRLDGDVRADVQVVDVSAGAITFNIVRTAACKSYKFTILPASTANYLSGDAQTADYIDSQVSETYSEDFTGGSVSATGLSANTKYAAITVGLDEYGTACGVSRSDFTTPRPALAGNPKVFYTIDTIEERAFTITFTPNSDVGGYACVAAVKGEIQSQYDMYATMFGYNNFGDMVKGWGYNNGTQTKTTTWNDMAPGTDYQVFVQAWDKNGAYADCDTINLTTLKTGGTGSAWVDITLGDYKLQDWNGQQLPSQFITFTPNDQTSSYHYNVALASEYDKDPEAYKSDVVTEPEQVPMYWYWYEALTTDFQINPSTEAVALAAARNSEGEWGEINVYRFTTPASAGAKAASRTWNDTRAPIFRHSPKPFRTLPQERKAPAQNSAPQSFHIQ